MAKEFVFHDITITISARNAKEAYTKLCELLTDTYNGVEYTTNTYEGPDGETHSCEDLYPTEGD